MNLDVYKLKNECNYFCDYYGQDFIKGLGTETILEFFNKYFIKSNWLDLGGGSSSLLWWLAQKYYNRIDIVDISKEAFFITDLIKSSNFKNGCFKYVRDNYYDKDFKNCKIKYILNDFLNKETTIKKRYLNISQIGLLGLCKDETSYKMNLLKIVNLLEPDGVLIGANWIFNQEYAKRKGIDNSYINTNLIKAFAKKHNLKLKECEFVKFVDDKNYEGVLIYVLQRTKI